MKLVLPDRIESPEDVVYADVEDLLTQAAGSPVCHRREDPSEPRIVLGRLGSSEPIHRLVESGAVPDPGLLMPDEILVHAVEGAGPPTVLATGGSPRAAGHAAYHLLEHVLGFGFFPVSDRIPDLGAWTPKTMSVRLRPAFKERLFLTHSFFAGPWRYCCRTWDADEWENLLTWVRRKRFTGIVCFHDEGSHMWGRAFFDAFPEVGRRGNLPGFVMDPDQRTDTNKHVFRFAREGGLRVVYKLMYSVLPNVFARAHPELTLHPQPTDSVSVCPGGPECLDIMRAFWEAVLETHPPEKEQVYFVSPYQHRRPTCEHVRGRGIPCLDAVELVTELDPDARIFVDTPCSPDQDLNRREWQDLAPLLPAGAGVVDWDSGLRTQEVWPELAAGHRSWMTTVHVSRTGLYPPVSVTIKPPQMREFWRAAREAGAEGVVTFNVLANSSTHLCDYAAELGWDPDLDPDEHMRGYCVRRYGAFASLAMKRAYQRMTASLVPALCLPQAPRSGERQLRRALDDGHLTDEWLRQRIGEANAWLEGACSARAFAMAYVPDDEAAIPGRFLKECAYVEWRSLGLLALLRSHKTHDPHEAAKLVVEAVERLRNLAQAYEQPDLSMEGVAGLGHTRGLRYTQWFLSDWRAVGGDAADYGGKAWLIPALEHFPDYEQAVLDAAPDAARALAIELLHHTSEGTRQ